MKVDIRKFDGSSSGDQIDLKKAVFGIEPHENSIYLAVKAEKANRRQGSASTLTRGEVAGSGIKLHRQKGTGRARVGDGQSPIRLGGGVAFGPKPRSYNQKVNRKVSQLARKSLLSKLQNSSSVTVVESFDLAEAKTKLMAQALDALGLTGKKVVILSASPTVALWRASNNLRGVQVKDARNVSSHDLWAADHLLVDKDGVKELHTLLS